MPRIEKNTMTHKPVGFAEKAGSMLDTAIGVVSPRIAFRRQTYRQASSYIATDGNRLRKKRTASTGSGDRHLTETKHCRLREIGRDLGRNNPIAKGLLQTETNGVVGSTISVKSKSIDPKWNKDADALWKEEMEESPCDTSGRFNFIQSNRIGFKSYRRDGDHLISWTGNEFDFIEGDCCGTPWGMKDADNYEVVNGVAYSKLTGKVIGYYIGKPDRWGFIHPSSFRAVQAEKVRHVFDPDRFTYSRGEPIFTASIELLDLVSDYIPAEVVAAKVNACFSHFIGKEDFTPDNLPIGYTGGVGADTGGEDEEGNRLQHIQPGIIHYGAPGEKPYPMGQVRPGNTFDPFIMRCLMIIGRPMCLPLALIGLDFSGATFMNMRFAYGEARDNFECQQYGVMLPHVAWMRRCKVDQWIRQRKLREIEGKYTADIAFRTWPYVDPFRQSQSDQIELENKTVTRKIICERQGYSFEEDILPQSKKEDEAIGVQPGNNKTNESQPGAAVPQKQDKGQA
jgi:capsid protein